jgi:putative hydrolase of the HAD superfamily
MFRRALELSGVAPGSAVMVGDRMVQDVWGAKRVGMRAIWRRPLAGAPQEPVDVEPDAAIDDMTELPPLLKRWM